MLVNLYDLELLVVSHHLGPPSARRWNRSYPVLVQCLNSTPAIFTMQLLCSSGASSDLGLRLDGSENNPCGSTLWLRGYAVLHFPHFCLSLSFKKGFVHKLHILTAIAVV